jgi:hypothetical protein
MRTKIHRVKAKPLSPAEAARLDREVAELAKLSTEELRARARPMTAAEAAQWERMRRGRPRKPPARKAKRVLFTIDPEVLKQADRYARSHGLTRAQLIANGLRRVMSA